MRAKFFAAPRVRDDSKPRLRAKPHEVDLRLIHLWRWGDPTAPLRASLDCGEIVAFPTESTYALGVDPWNAAGVEAIYRAKGRPRDKALPVVIAELSDLARLGVAVDLPILAPVLERLAKVWPAPLTAILPLAGSSHEHPAAAGGLETLAVRVPAHERLRELLREVGPLTATSANPSGEAAALRMEELTKWLQEPAWVVLEEGLLGGLPSTMIAFDGGRARIVREGRLAAGEVLGWFEE